MKPLRRVLAVVPAACLSLAGAAVIAPAAHAAVPASGGDIQISEVESDGGTPGDWVELHNTGVQDEDLSGWWLSDDGGKTGTDHFTIPDGLVIAAGDYVAFDVDAGSAPAYFGLGGADSVRLFDAGDALVDSVDWTDHAGGTYDRCAIDAAGHAGWLDVAVSTKGAANDCPAAATALATVKSGVEVDEVVADNGDGSDGEQRPDWIELANTGTVTLDLTDWWLSDDTAADKDVFAARTSIAPGGFAAYGVGGSDSADPGIALPWGASKVKPDFGLGAGGDQAAIVAPDGTDADRVTWGAGAVPPAAPGDAIARDADGAWVETTTLTPGAANEITAPGGTTDPGGDVDPNWANVTINEVSSDNATAEQKTAGDPLSDAIELYNKGDAAVDLTGWRQIDGGDAGAATTFGPLYVNGSTTAASSMTIPGHGYAVFSSTKGLGSGGDAVKLYLPDGTLVDSLTYGAGEAGLDEAADPDNTFRSVAACPDGSDAFLKVKAYSLGASNAAACATGETLGSGTTPTSDVPCDTEAPGATTAPVSGALPWPGSAAVAVADDQCAWVGGGSGQDLSGLVFDPTDPDTLWAVKNKSVVYKLAKTDGVWRTVTTDGWADGKAITFPSGTGQPDSEGMTVGPDGALYITTERDNAHNDVPLDTILRFDPTASGTTLVATDEWDLTADVFPARDSADANLGFEGVTYVPDSYLTANGFIDETTHTFYKPSAYAKKTTAGLFFAAVEKTGHLEAYALNGDHTFTRVADIATGMAGVMDVAYDAGLERIWAQCDNTCGVTLDLLKVGSDGHVTPERQFARPAGLPDNNIEGFAVAPLSTAVAGQREVVWSDDGNFGTSTTGAAMSAADGGHSLWRGLMDADLGLGSQGYQPPTGTQPGDGDDGGPGGSGGGGTGAVPGGASAPTHPATVVFHPLAGKAKVGKKLKVVLTLPAGATVTYKWFAGGKRIKGAHKHALKLTKKLRHKRVKVKVVVRVPGQPRVVRMLKVHRPVR